MISSQSSQPPPTFLVSLQQLLARGRITPVQRDPHPAFGCPEGLPPLSLSLPSEVYADLRVRPMPIQVPLLYGHLEPLQQSLPGLVQELEIQPFGQVLPSRVL